MSHPVKSAFERHLSKSNHTFPIESLVKQVLDGDVDMSPEYQRGLVWAPKQKEKLIDSIFWGVSIPAIYYRRLEILDSGPWLEVIDGKQRLTTLVDYMQDKFDYNGFLYSELSNRDKYRFRMTIIPSIHVEGLSDAEVIELFNRINFCGVPHEKPYEVKS